MQGNRPRPDSGCNCGSIGARRQGEEEEGGRRDGLPLPPPHAAAPSHPLALRQSTTAPAHARAQPPSPSTQPLPHPSSISPPPPRRLINTPLDEHTAQGASARLY